MERKGAGTRDPGPVSAAVMARAAIAVAMLAGFYLLAAACVLVVLLVSFYLAVPVGLGPTVMLGGLGIAVTLAVNMVRSMHVRPWSQGRRLRRAEAPRLWRLVEDVAARVGTRPPDELWLVDEVNAGVMETTGRLGLVEGRRYLVLGVPLLQGLSTAQLRGVLAHEMGHYAKAHTTLLQISFRGHQAIALILGQLQRQRFNPAAWVLLAYSVPYVLVQLAISRRQEFEADRRAAELVGGPVMMSALLESDRVVAAWDYFMEHYVGPGLKLGLAPTGVFDGFGRYLRCRPKRLEWTDQDEVPVALSTHPPTAARIAALKPLPGRRGAGGEESSDRLLPGFDRLVKGLEDGLLKPGKRARLSFDEYLTQCHARTGMNTTRRTAAVAYRVIGEVAGDASPSMATVLDLVAAGRGVELRDRLRRAEFPEHGFNAMVLVAAVGAGSMRVAPRWRQSPAVAFDEDSGLTVERLAAALARTETASVFTTRDLLARAGIDPAKANIGTTGAGRRAADWSDSDAEPEPDARDEAAEAGGGDAADGDEPGAGPRDEVAAAAAAPGEELAAAAATGDGDAAGSRASVDEPAQRTPPGAAASDGGSGRAPGVGPPAGARITGGLATLRLNRDPHDLVLTSEGLLFLPSTRSTRGGEARLWMLIDTADLPRIADRPGRRWLPYDHVVAVRLWRRNPLHVTIIDGANRSWEVKRSWTSEELPGSSASLLDVLSVFAED